MAFPFSPKPPPFTAATLIEGIRTTFREFPDERRGGNHQRYTLDDAALSAFSVFFTQSPSFLDYQRRMQRRLGQNNAQSLFGARRYRGVGIHDRAGARQAGSGLILIPIAGRFYYFPGDG